MTIIRVLTLMTAVSISAECRMQPGIAPQPATLNLLSYNVWLRRGFSRRLKPMVGAPLVSGSPRHRGRDRNRDRSLVSAPSGLDLVNCRSRLHRDGPVRNRTCISAAHRGIEQCAASASPVGADLGYGYFAEGAVFNEGTLPRICLHDLVVAEVGSRGRTVPGRLGTGDDIAPDAVDIVF